MPICLLMRDRNDVDQDGRGAAEEPGRVGRRETIIKIYEKNLF